MTDIIKLTNIHALAYPFAEIFSTGDIDLAVKLALLSEDEKAAKAAELEAQLPAGKVSFKLNMPIELGRPRTGPDPNKYYGHVRYVQQYDPVHDRIIGRMHLGYGDEVTE